MDLIKGREIGTEDVASGLGGGWDFPVKVSSGGFVQASYGKSHVDSCVLHFAEYDYEDLVGTPTFGGGVPSLVFNLLAPNILKRKEDQMYDGLKFWEPRINDLIVSVVKSSTEMTSVIETIQYSLAEDDSEGGTLQLSRSAEGASE